ncbi:P-loop NTPase fold protein [Ferruginibacter albus]|uniref:P-loop NTPase fold protein n=1 Tax=Ferruginibacter albus TaxID=2875540 RepID=UPI001CC341C8|nr:P-loop NTPase fold protein [Ferruginibacter albus]UAY51280.1 KAP family NTPase [Ferruginibacter albus]
MKDIGISEVSRRFENHLQIEKNFRVIVSGKFGFGKTYFVDKFFKERKEKFNNITLFPVNYVISNNEDIFELIKADILKELFLTNKIELKEIKKDTKAQKTSLFFENKPYLIYKFLIKFLSKLNPTLEVPVSLLNELKKISKEYEKNQQKESKTLSQEVFNYASESENKIGSIYEYNYVTKAINILLDEIKTDGKKNVLVIDDLDRIDPEHIFRILNILSAHNNHFGAENKFHFDYIILVCDIDNIKNIFYHKYGNNVDFDGYIDKFYSTDIFKFSNDDAVENYIDSIEIAETKEEKAFQNFLLKKLVRAGLSVRKLIKCRFELNFPTFETDRTNSFKTWQPFSPRFANFNSDFVTLSTDVKIIYFIKLMSIVYGDLDRFKSALENLKREKDNEKDKNLFEIASFILLQNHILKQNGIDLYFSYNKYSDGVGRINLSDFDWPIIKYKNIRFRICLKWRAGNVYDSAYSYFSEAKLQHDPHSGNFDSDITNNDIINIFEGIVNEVINRDYMKYL